MVLEKLDTHIKKEKGKEGRKEKGRGKGEKRKERKGGRKEANNQGRKEGRIFFFYIHYIGKLTLSGLED